MSLIVDLHKDQEQIKEELVKIRLTVCERIIVTFIHFGAKAIHLLIIYLIMATYNIGYIMINASGLMMGNLIFGLIKDSIVINRVKREKKELEINRVQMTEMLKMRKSTVMMGHGGLTSANFAALDTDRDQNRAWKS